MIEFDKQHLTARAGRVAFVLINEKRKGHNIRVQTGAVCCFRPGSQDIGGTRTISTGRTRAVLQLKTGRVRVSLFGRRPRAHAARPAGRALIGWDLADGTAHPARVR